MQRRKGGKRMGQGKHRRWWTEDAGTAGAILGASDSKRLDLLGPTRIRVEADPGANRGRNTTARGLASAVVAAGAVAAVAAIVVVPAASVLLLAVVAAATTIVTVAVPITEMGTVTPPNSSQI
jgi:hypothetical protein